MEGGGVLAQLVKAWDRERAALGDALHGGVLQNLAAAAMNLATNHPDESAPTSAMAADAVRLINESIADVRALSYCAEPPFVRDLGMRAALETYAGAFTRMYGSCFDLVGMSPVCASLKDDLAVALVRSVRDASYAFIEAGAVAIEAEATDVGDAIHASVQGDFAELSAESGFEVLAAVATERLRPFDGVGEIQRLPKRAKFVARAIAGRSI